MTTAVADQGVMPVDPDGRFCAFNQVPLNLVVDVQGYFAPSGAAGQAFVPQPPDAGVGPTRELDTHEAPFDTPASGGITRVETTSPPGTSAVLVNLTMVNGVAPGYITADTCAEMVVGPQSESTGNHDIRTASANLAVVPVASDGSFCIFSQQSVDLVVDLQGTFSSTGSQLFFPIGPNRVLDTRAA